MIVHWTTNFSGRIQMVMTPEEAVDFIDLILAAKPKDIPDSMVEAVHSVVACYSALTGKDPAPHVDWEL